MWLSNSSTQRPHPTLFHLLGLFGLLFSLGCSVGSLIVQVSTPTPVPRKTPQATFTITPIRTATFTVTPTPTETPTPTPTPTETPSPTPTEQAEEEEAPPAQPEAQAPSEPVEPTATPTPEEPAATPTPAFPFNVVYYQHDTGSPGETRITGWIRIDYGPGRFKTLANFQMKVTAPDGNTYLSEISGPGAGDSTVRGTGDNHLMNTKFEIQPYTPGSYKVFLEEGGVQVSPEIELALGADPRQYVHFDFFKTEEESSQ